MEKEGVMNPPNDPESIRPCGMYVDQEGNWYHEENRIVRDDMIELFLENVQLTPSGTYLIRWNEALCSLDVADTVFVVWRVDRAKVEDSTRENLLLGLKHLSQPERLDPATLWVGKDNVLYCLIRDGLFPARFSRPAYYQLASMIQEETTTGGFYLELNGVRFPIRIDETDKENGTD